MAKSKSKNKSRNKSKSGKDLYLYSSKMRNKFMEVVESTVDRTDSCLSVELEDGAVIDIISHLLNIVYNVQEEYPDDYLVNMCNKYMSDQEVSYLLKVLPDSETRLFANIRKNKNTPSVINPCIDSINNLSSHLVEITNTKRVELINALIRCENKNKVIPELFANFIGYLHKYCITFDFNYSFSMMDIFVVYYWLYNNEDLKSLCGVEYMCNDFLEAVKKGSLYESLDHLLKNEDRLVIPMASYIIVNSTFFSEYGFKGNLIQNCCSTMLGDIVVERGPEYFLQYMHLDNHEVFIEKLTREFGKYNIPVDEFLSIVDLDILSVNSLLTEVRSISFNISGDNPLDLEVYAIITPHVIMDNVVRSLTEDVVSSDAELRTIHILADNVRRYNVVCSDRINNLLLKVFQKRLDKLSKSTNEIDSLRKDRKVFKDKYESIKIELKVVERECAKAKAASENKDKEIADLKKRVDYSYDSEEIEDIKAELNSIREKNLNMSKEIAEYDRKASKMSSDIDWYKERIKFLEDTNKMLEDNLMEERDRTESISLNSHMNNIPSSCFVNALKDKSIILVGGDKLYASLKDYGFTNVKLVNSLNTRVSSIEVESVDLIVHATAMTKHALVENYENVTAGRDTKVLYFSYKNVDILLYQMFQELFA